MAVVRFHIVAADYFSRGSPIIPVFFLPALRELWRTGPYLYDGRAAELGEALRIKSRAAAGLAEEELAALVAYLRAW